MVKKITEISVISLYLNDYSKRIYLREIASLLEKPHQTIKPYVEKLVKEKILIKNKKKAIIEFSLNFKNKKVYDYLIIAEKEKLFERVKEDEILDILYEKLSPNFSENIFVIFGSASEKIKKGSDIDLLIIGKKDVKKEIKDFENIYNKRIHKIEIEDIERLTRALIKEIYDKHLIFNNAEKIVRFFGGLYEQNKLV